MANPDPSAPRVLVRATERGPAFPSTHPYNARAELHVWLLSRPAGLSRIAVNLGRIPPGKESGILHAHHREEEWLYVLSGRGVAEVDGREHEVGPGDFAGFSPGVAHHLRNAAAEDLVVLVGGEVFGDVEVADFPAIQRRLVRAGARYAVYPHDAEVPFLPPAAQEALAALLAPRPAREPRPALLPAAAQKPPRTIRHEENPRSEVLVTPLSRPTGLARVAVNLARVPPGRESFVHHLHHAQEEWMFVLAGRGIAEVGDAEHDVLPGDFLGFPAGGPGHHLRNPAAEELVYLAGGDAFGGVEVVDYPRLGRRKVWLGRRGVVYPVAGG